MRIQLVEDNLGFGAGLVTYLADRGHDVDWSLDPAEALQKAPMLLPEVLVSDFLFPDDAPHHKAIDMIRRFRATPALAGVPVVVLTAAVGADRDGLDCLARADPKLRLLAKPCEPAELARVLNEITGAKP